MKVQWRLKFTSTQISLDRVKKTLKSASDIFRIFRNVHSEEVCGFPQLREATAGKVP